MRVIITFTIHHTFFILYFVKFIVKRHEVLNLYSFDSQVKKKKEKSEFHKLIQKIK